MFAFSPSNMYKCTKMILSYIIKAQSDWFAICFRPVFLSLFQTVLIIAFYHIYHVLPCFLWYFLTVKVLSHSNTIWLLWYSVGMKTGKVWVIYFDGGWHHWATRSENKSKGSFIDYSFTERNCFQTTCQAVLIFLGGFMHLQMISLHFRVFFLVKWIPGTYFYHWL